jgi:hypothetical protein
MAEANRYTYSTRTNPSSIYNTGEVKDWWETRCDVLDRYIHDNNVDARLECKSCEGKKNLTTSTAGYKHNTAALQQNPFNRHVTETWEEKGKDRKKWTF